MPIELKPCPFCGSVAIENYDEKCDEWWICCGHGSCSIEPKVAMRDYRDAASAWNRRPLPEEAGWISVFDHFPTGDWGEGIDASGSVLICTEGGVGTAAYDRAKSVWFSGGLTKECGRVDFQPHNQPFWWKPLPKALRREDLPYHWMSLEDNARRAAPIRVPQQRDGS